MAHAALSRKTLTSSGVTESAISISAVRNICPRTWWTRSNIAFACGFLIVVGLRLIPYESHRYSKFNLNSLPLLYTRYQHLGYLLNQNLLTSREMQSELLSKISLDASNSLPSTVIVFSRWWWRNPLGLVPMLGFIRCLTLVSIEPTRPNRLGVTL